MKEHFRRRRLPHLDKPGAIYFATSCLHGSIPALGLLEIAKHRRNFARQAAPQDMTTIEWEQSKWKLAFAESDDWLDRSLVSCHLSDHRLAAVVEKALLHFAGERYAVWSWVVMPNHFHWVFEPLSSWVESLGIAVDERTPRERIMHSVKKHSARECNKLRGDTDTFWQAESYDHCVEDAAELARIIDYVEQNPVKAGLVKEAGEYRFSSSYFRKLRRIPVGRPLIGVTELTALD